MTLPLKIYVPIKFCPICKTWFPRPIGKSNKVWQKQTYCGKDCACLAIRKENPVGGTYRRKELNPGDRRFAR